MRNEQEMFDLILGFAKTDERVRAVFMNGSRANPNAPRDKYQDFDIVYVVREFDSFLKDLHWIDRFGERLMLQMPEAMRDPCGDGRFNWMMLFTDGNRLDLTLIPIEKPELIGDDSATVVLLDKDGVLPVFYPASDRDYWVKKPDELFYFSCCNNFWWCMQNVAKGVARGELPYAMMMYHTVVRQDLHDMLEWYIGCRNGFAVSAGKMGKYFRKFLPAEWYAQYEKTYSGAEPEAIWESLFAAGELFRTVSKAVAAELKYPFLAQDAENMTRYMQTVREESKTK